MKQVSKLPTTGSLGRGSHLITDSTRHYDDVTMSRMASQITSLTTVYSTVYPGLDQRKHQSPASLAFVRHKWPVTRKLFPFDDVIRSNRIAVRRICNQMLSLQYENRILAFRLSTFMRRYPGTLSSLPHHCNSVEDQVPAYFEISGYNVNEMQSTTKHWSLGELSLLCPHWVSFPYVTFTMSSLHTWLNYWRQSLSFNHLDNFNSMLSSLPNSYFEISLKLSKW